MRNLMINNFLNNFATLLSKIICVLIFIAFAKMNSIPLKLRFFLSIYEGERGHGQNLRAMITHIGFHRHGPT